MLPGVLVQVSLMATISTGMNLATDIGNGVFDRFRTMPIARSAPLTGRVLADLLTLLITVAMSLAVGYAVGFRVTTDPLSALAGIGLVLVMALALSWGSAWIGLVAKSVTSMQGMATAVLLPLTFGSSAFVPMRRHARLAELVDGRQPGLAPGRRPARAPGRRAGGGRRVDHARLDGGTARPLRPARPPRLQQADPLISSPYLQQANPLISPSCRNTRIR